MIPKRERLPVWNYPMSHPTRMALEQFVYNYGDIIGDIAQTFGVELDKMNRIKYRGKSVDPYKLIFLILFQLKKESITKDYAKRMLKKIFLTDYRLSLQKLKKDEDMYEILDTLGILDSDANDLENPTTLEDLVESVLRYEASAIIHSLKEERDASEPP
jgi:hypothetical protein